MSKELADQNTLKKLTDKFDGKAPIRIHFLDNSSKVFLVDPTETIKDLLCMCLEKMQIVNVTDNLPYYGIYESKSGGNIDGCIDMEVEIDEVMHSWEDAGVEKTAKFLCCIRLFMPCITGLQYKDVVAYQLNKPKRSVTQNLYLESTHIVDESALHMQHIQAIYNVITGRYITTPDEALELGAVHFLSKFGEFNEESHVPGFLAGRIVEFIPVKHLKSSSGGSIEDWEIKLLAKAKELSGTMCFTRNSKKISPQRKYMDIIFSMPYFGCTFFKVTQKTVRGLPETLCLGVHHLGMYIFDKSKKNLLCAFHIEELFRWGFQPNLMFYFEFDSDGVLGTRLETGTLEFDTTDGKTIADLLTDYAVSFLKEREAEDLRYAHMKAGTFSKNEGVSGVGAKDAKPTSASKTTPPAPPSVPAPAHKPASAATSKSSSKSKSPSMREENAATKIQALARGALLRGEWAREDAAILIQSVFRGYQGRVKLSVMIEEMIAAGEL